MKVTRGENELTAVLMFSASSAIAIIASHLVRRSVKAKTLSEEFEVLFREAFRWLLKLLNCRPLVGRKMT
jgi:hypothetical protein